ncbi:acylphosphatase [Coriobacterium glomerans PW2]|uniref:acylphosphatase n=1 Tax=Coriobacterium glomerans (strain ATCC 49209 / DSM 20642 / JCM 10262 / PW2) TaxID=700015 RepID=F2N8K8_CORGP|nr:acylphosphatase [Coriobacterium glomerans]AEB07391.1 acylphosphatase [Coriobacterium glomerans PW2]
MSFIDRLREIAEGAGREGDRSGPGAKPHRSDLELELLRRLQQRAKADGARMRLHLRFTGTVQGVGFRWTNRGIARDSNETGWVRNLDDGSVEMELQAAPADIMAHLKALHDYYDRMGCRVWLEQSDEMPTRQTDADFDVRL